MSVENTYDKVRTALRELEKVEKELEKLKRADDEEVKSKKEGLKRSLEVGVIPYLRNAIDLIHRL